jgi:hypothetical protein
MAGFFDFLMPQNSGLDPQQSDYARRIGFLNAATQLADMSADHAGPKVSPLQLLTHGLGGFQSGSQGAMDQFYKNQGTQTQGAQDVLQGEIYKQDLDWQKKNNNFGAYKSNLSDPTKLSSWYSKPTPVADKLGLTGIDAAQVAQESGGDPNAVSPAGAAGIAQIMPETALKPGYGVKPLQGMTRTIQDGQWKGMPDPASAPIEEQLRFMRDYRSAMPFDTMEGKLAAYNAGPGKMQDVLAGKAQMPAETAAYVPKIMGGVQTAMAGNTGTMNDASPVPPAGMSQEEYALRMAYLGERQMRTPKGGGSDLMQTGMAYNPNFKKNGDESVSYADWQKMTPAQQEDYKKFKTAWQPSALGGTGLFGGADAPDTNLSGEDFLKTLPPQMQSVVKLIAEGNERSSTILSRMKPQDKIAILDAVSRYKSDYSANQFAANKEWNTGKLGSTVRSLNVATSHLDILSNLADALDNNDTKALNTIGNMWAEQTGGEAPTNFDTAKQIVADEVVKAVVGAGGALADREEAARVINAANSPAQLKGAIQTYKTLMRGQLKGLQLQYKHSTGRDDFESFLEEGVSEDAQPEDDFVKNAKAHGYSDAEIQEYLRKKNGQ